MSKVLFFFCEWWLVLQLCKRCTSSLSHNVTFKSANLGHFVCGHVGWHSFVWGHFIGARLSAEDFLCEEQSHFVWCLRSSLALSGCAVKRRVSGSAWSKDPLGRLPARLLCCLNSIAANWEAPQSTKCGQVPRVCTYCTACILDIMAKAATTIKEEEFSPFEFTFLDLT